ncbi:hypothetical protein FPQ18DRAFT_316049 [Pyronema domesticum]|nr:hypothetical protein FPQ18DRAFT_316049 [Pyronema domesticum]
MPRALPILDILPSFAPLVAAVSSVVRSLHSGSQRSSLFHFSIVRRCYPREASGKKFLPRFCRVHAQCVALRIPSPLFSTISYSAAPHRYPPCPHDVNQSKPSNSLCK